jgi:CRISPR-associated protein Cst1
VNLDTTVDDLYKINNTVENFILPSRENPYKVIIRNMLLDFQQKKSRWTLGNILFVEFDTESAPYKVQHFHVPSYVAKLFEGDNYKDFKQLDGFYYKEKKEDTESINVFKKIIDHLLNGISLYGILNKTLRDLLLGKHNRSNGLFNIVKIQKSLDIYKIGRDDMKEKATKKLWSLYYEGQDIAKELRREGAENKIDSIAYKMLSSLRVRDAKSFYDTMLRLYMNLGREVPATFLETFSPDSVLDAEALGYAFLTGLLGKEYLEHTEKGGNSNE